ncbi:unnamed protein product [Brugia timori]|uniref:Uncharacterized protein n=1 Tax=Brugia timori TaxID=42155 RepID=A0A3P7VPP2_9BILA|nr:unnamed protein product [Brugia timori]
MSCGRLSELRLVRLPTPSRDLGVSVPSRKKIVVRLEFLCVL